MKGLRKDRGKTSGPTDSRRGKVVVAASYGAKGKKTRIVEGGKARRLTDGQKKNRIKLSHSS